MAKNRNPLKWMKFDPEIVGLETDHLTMPERGAYFTLIRHLWVNGPMPEDRIKSILRTYSEAIIPCLTDFDGSLSMRWLEEARDTGSKLSDSQSERALRGWEKRHAQSMPGHAVALPGDAELCPTNAEGEGEGEGKKRRKRSAPASTLQRPSWRLAKEVRIAAFIEACREVVTKDPKRLDEDERVGFFEYWTEGNEKGKMLFEMAKVFDHGRRMDRWMKVKMERLSR